MASVFSKLARFASSPQGKRMLSKAKRMANDPRTQKQAKDALKKLRNRGKGTPPTGR